jgi:hypothetical protein
MIIWIFGLSPIEAGLAPSIIGVSLLGSRRPHYVVGSSDPSGSASVRISFPFATVT